MKVNHNGEGGWGYKSSDKHSYDYNRDIQNIDMYLQF